MAIASLSDFGRMAELESIVEISTCRKGTEARRGMNESNRSDCIHASNMQVRRSSKQKQDLIHCWRRATCRVPPPPRAPRRLPAPRPPDKPNHRQENPISLEPRRGRRAEVSQLIDELERVRAATAAARPEVPEQFVCPITGEIMEDPVMTADGHAYDRDAIAQWLQSHDTSPITNAQLAHRDLAPAHALRQLIEEFVAANPGI